MKKRFVLCLESARLRHNARVWLRAWEEGLCIAMTESGWYFFTGELTVPRVVITFDLTK